VGKGQVKKAHRANVQYLRFGRVYVILATLGAHPFFESEKARIKDARETPIRVGAGPFPLVESTATPVSSFCPAPIRFRGQRQLESVSLVMEECRGA
jgi:hypothetical protein